MALVLRIESRIGRLGNEDDKSACEKWFFFSGKKYAESLVIIIFEFSYAMILRLL